MMHYLDVFVEEVDVALVFILIFFFMMVGGIVYYFGAPFLAPPFILIYKSYPFWAPYLLTFIFWNVWLDYKRSEYIKNMEYSLLEILLPRDVFKSPLAMELALAGLHITSGESSHWKRYVHGQMRAQWSLEIASIEGHIHFYIWTRKYLKHVVESQLYGQYPGVEIQEVSDYTDTAPYFDYNIISLWGNEYVLREPDPYPIRTYMDFGLDKDPKEEFKIDPLTSVLEYMGGIGKGEQMWLQFIIRPHGKIHKPGTLFGKTDWKEQGKELIKQRLADLTQKPTVTDDGQFTYMRIPTKGEAEVLAAIDHNISKTAFDVGARVVYVAKKENFVGGRVPPIINLMKPFNTGNLNGFRPTKYTDFDYPWEDIYQIRVNHMRRKMLENYRRRAFFHAPYRHNNFVLNTESLATIFHLPGGVLQAPSVSRILSKKVEPPSNLPR